MIESEINNNNNNKDEDKQTNDKEGKYQNRAEEEEEEANINCSRQDIPLITANKTTNEDRSKRQLITTNTNDTNRDIDVNKRRDIFCLFGGNEDKNNNKGDDDDDDVERNRKVNTIRNDLTTTNDDDYSKYSRYVYYYPYDRDVDYLSNGSRNNISKKRVNFDLIDREQEINSNYLKKICDATENDVIERLNALNNDKK